MISRAEAERWIQAHDVLKNGRWENKERLHWLISSPFRTDEHPSWVIFFDTRSCRDRATDERMLLSEFCQRLGIPEPGDWSREGKNTAAGPDYAAIIRNGEAKKNADKSAEARRLWEQASPAGADHHYIERKKISPEGLRVLTSDRERPLVVPAFAIETGALISVERIYPDRPKGDRDKMHLGPKEGTYFPRGDMDADGPLLIAEGMATAASLHALSGWTAVSVFGEGALLKAARLFKSKYPGRSIIVAPDFDDAGRKAGGEARKEGFMVVELPEGSAEKYDWNDVHVKRGLEQGKEIFRDCWQAAEAAGTMDAETREEKEPAVGEVPSRRRGVTLLHGSELVYRPREHLVRGLIMPNSLSVIYGPPGGAKTFFCLDMALSIASGQAFLGHRTKEGPTVYVGAEGADEVAKRLEAWDMEKAACGVSYKNIPFYYVPHAVTIPQTEHRDALVEAVLERVEAELDGVAPVAVYLDTLARCSDGDENSNSDMSLFIAAADEIRARLNGCAVVLVHHTPKSDPETLRGASALHGAVDTALCLLPVGAGTEQEQELALKVKKQKDLPQGRDEYLARVQVELPFEDYYGDAATSCIIEAREGRSEADKPLKGNSKAALDALFAAAKEHGVRVVDGLGAGVHIEAWRECFYRVSTADNPDTKRKAFGRARDDLRDKGVVGVSDDVYAPLRDADRLLLNSARVERLIGGENSPKDSGTSGTKAGHVPLCPARNPTEAGQDGTHSVGVSRCPARVVPDGEGKKENPSTALSEERAVGVPSPRGQKILGAKDVAFKPALAWCKGQPGLMKRLALEAKKMGDGGMMDAGDYLNTAVKCEYADWLNSEAAGAADQDDSSEAVPSTSQGADMEPASTDQGGGVVSSLADKEPAAVSLEAIAALAGVDIEVVREELARWQKAERVQVSGDSVTVTPGGTGYPGMGEPDDEPDDAPDDGGQDTREDEIDTAPEESSSRGQKGGEAVTDDKVPVPDDKVPDAAPDAAQEPDEAAMRAWLAAQGEDVQAEHQERLDRLRRAGLDADGRTALATTYRSRHPILPDRLKPVLSEKD